MSSETITINGVDLDPFARAYIRTALWSSTDNATPSGGEPLDANYSEEDFSEEALKEIVADCEGFKAANSARWEHVEDRWAGGENWTGEQSAAHDFWLTRCGHGCGFWDTDRQELYGVDNATNLDYAAKEYGECHIYVGDDGLLYI